MPVIFTSEYGGSSRTYKAGSYEDVIQYVRDLRDHDAAAMKHQTTYVSITFRSSLTARATKQMLEDRGFAVQWSHPCITYVVFFI